MKTNRFFSVLLLAFGLSNGVAQNNVTYSTINPTPGTENVLIGRMIGTSQGPTPPAGTITITAPAAKNTIVGNFAGNRLETGISNTFMGNGAGGNTTDKSNNTYIGSGSGAFAKGQSNTFLGASSGFGANTFISTGDENTYVGAGSGYYANASGSQNVFVGASSGAYANGSNNIYIGNKAGYFHASAPSTGNSNIFIGNQVGFGIGFSAVSDMLLIHNNNVPDPLITGNFFDESLTFNVNKSGGANARVNIVSNLGGVNGYSGLRLQNLTSANNTSFTSNGKVLTVNQFGDLVLTSDQVGPGGNINITAGDFITVSGNGSVGTPYLIGAQNIYNDDDFLRGDRTVSLNGRNLIFSTLASGPAVAGGRVFIGDVPTAATPYDYKLYVENGIMTEKIRVAVKTTADWQDSVFAKEYELMSLDEVETYVKQNSHLPGIKSAQELVKNGLDLGEMQSKQMGKIEELTLYLIEQNKKLETQQSEIEALKVQVQLLLQGK